MGNNIIVCNTDEAIVASLKQIILSKYPIVDNRIDMLSLDGVPELKILLRFYECDGLDITRVLFLEGNNVFKFSMSESLTISGLISTSAIFSFFNYLLSDHSFVSNFSKDSSSFLLAFDMTVSEEEMRGIGCGKIEVEFDFSKHPNCRDLINYYLKSVVKTFYEALRDTTLMQREFADYCDVIKTNFLMGLSEDEVRDFLSLCDKETLSILGNALPNDVFAELYGRYACQKRELK